MFNRKFVTETKLINTKKQTPTSINVAPAPKTPTLIDQITKEDLVKATVGAVGVYTSVVLVNTLSKIALHIATK